MLDELLLSDAVERGCGFREFAGIYLDTGLSPYGQSLGHFLFDAPVLLDVAALGISPIGVTLIEDPDGMTHVLDWVGAQHYPNLCDFVEEARRFGISRRVPKNLDFSRLTSESKILLLHSRAHIDNHGEYYEAAGDAPWECPKEREEHGEEVPEEMCAALWWQDMADGYFDPTFNTDVWIEGRTIRRDMPSFSYVAHLRPEGVTPQYQVAMFAAFPIGALTVVNDPAGGRHEAALIAAAKSRLPVVPVDR